MKVRKPKRRDEEERGKQRYIWIQFTEPKSENQIDRQEIYSTTYSSVRQIELSTVFVIGAFLSGLDASLAEEGNEKSGP